MRLKAENNRLRRYQLAYARQNFFYFCHLLAPDFYKEDRQYLRTICDEFQNFYESDSEQALIVNIPPRHGKSRTAGMFVEWVLGKNINEKVMTGSYNETLSTTFSKNVRNAIQETKADKDKIVYSDIFPHTKIKRGDGSMNLWSLEGGYNNYLATSPSGTATGFGASILAVDDLIKSAEEACNETVLEKHWEWFTNTMLSRLEEGGKMIIIMTRWANGDLAGRLMDHFDSNDIKYRKLIMQAVDKAGNMLCEDVLSRKSYDMKVKAMGADIASANYQQIPIDVKGRLYTSHKTYTDIPRDINGNPLFTGIKAYIDTADMGKDYLCGIIYGIYEKEAYILDIYYTKDAMEITEKEVAKRLHKYKVNIADIESNNGGRGFARAVERILLEQFKSNRCSIKWFHQSKNKVARILSNATWVMEHIYFPANWRELYPEAYDSFIRYQREGKNKHDDLEDCLTGVAEKVGKGATFQFF